MNKKRKIAQGNFNCMANGHCGWDDSYHDVNYINGDLVGLEFSAWIDYLTYYIR